MCERKAAARKWKANLSRMQVAGDYEMERTRPDVIDYLGEMTDENSQVRVRVRKSVRVCDPVHVRTWIHARDLHPAAIQFDNASLVRKQRRLSEVVQLGRFRPRIAADSEVVIPEDGVTVGQPVEQRTQERLSSWTRQEVAADQGQVRPPLLHPGNGSLDCRRSAGGNSEMKIGEVCDPQPSELVRQAGDRNGERAKADPAGFEVSPGEAGRRRARKSP